MTAGILGFFITLCLIALNVLGTFFIEEVVLNFLERRKGFLGTKASTLDYYRRQMMRLLRAEGDWQTILRSAIKCTMVLLAASLIPTGFEGTSLQLPHSLWIFAAMMIVTPLLALNFQWILTEGFAWPLVLRSAERSLGSITTIVVLLLAVVTLFGADSIEVIHSVQQNKGWVLFSSVSAWVILACFVVVTHFLCFQTIFKMSATNDGPEGMHLESLSIPLQRATWSLFLATIFLGGAQPVETLLGLLVLSLKGIAINIFGSFVFYGMFRFNEMQAESLILWKMVPVGVVIYLFVALVG